MGNKTALILGATGLIGNELLQLLLKNDDYNTVKIFVRKEIELKHPKLQNHIVDFDSPESWANLVNGDELFSAFGTTIKKAGSKENQYKIDVSYQFNIAKTAADNNVEKYILVSSAGANSKSGVFYNHIKGRLEDKVKDLDFKQKVIFRPSVLIGNRPEKRKMESLGIWVLNLLSFLPFTKKYKPIEGKIVAQAMINAAKSEKPQADYILDDIFNIARL